MFAVCLVGDGKRLPISTLNHYTLVIVESGQHLFSDQHSCGLDGFSKEVRVKPCRIKILWKF